MAINKDNLETMISKILQEEIYNNDIDILKEMEEGGEWTEIEVDEELHGNQKKLDKNKNGKIDAEDFKLLRKKTSKKETDESFFEDDELEDAEEASQLEPTYVGKGLKDNEIKAKIVNKMFGSFNEEEAETDEGNKFTEMLRKTPKGGKFKLGGKEYTDNSDLNEGKKCSKCGKANCECKKTKKEVGEKWDKDVEVKKTGQYADMSIEDLNKAIKKQKSKNDKTKESGKKVSHADKTKMSQLYFAKRAKKDWPGKGKAAVKENKLSLSLSEEELIDLIEKIVLDEQKKKKDNFTERKPEGLKKTEKVLKADQKENDDYAKEVVEKMKNYLKNSTKGTFEMNPTDFPKGNNELDKKEKAMKYNPSQAVEEYIEAFAYPGQTNLVFDEIKPDDEKIKMYLKGNRKTGNAEVDENGDALGNVVPSKVGDRFMKNYEENLYGAEQMEVSYKRQPQPVDVGGTEKMAGSLKSIRKSSGSKAQKIMNQLESVEEKKKNPINEDISKMKGLISYNRKTQ
jgi:hypothetical protein